MHRFFSAKAVDTSWKENLLKNLGPSYVEVEMIVLKDIRLIVFANKRSLPLIRRVRTGKEATGVGNLYGNKGCVAIAMEVEGSSLCFVNCHLAANMEYCHSRNSDIQNIASGLSSQLDCGLHEITTAFTHLFWFGDLNYRVELSFDQGLTLVKSGNYQELLKHDQLRRERRLQNTLFGFAEMDIAFLPSYRMNRFSAEYSHEKRRTPSFCDRILWKSQPEAAIRPRDYGVAWSIVTSDHRPVFASFDMEVLPMTYDFPMFDFIFEFSELSARGLRPPVEGQTALIDPFVTFRIDWNDSQVSTLQEKRSFNPKWQDSSVPVLTVKRCSVELLLHRPLLVAVRDDISLGLAREMIGVGLLCVREVVEKADSGEWTLFQVPIYLQTTPRGTVFGRIRVTKVPRKPGRIPFAKNFLDLLS